MYESDSIELPQIYLLYLGENMKIRSLEVNNIGKIKYLKLFFNDGVNVICGTNGVGKTTILNIIADAFAYSSLRGIKRNAIVEEGKYIADFGDYTIKERITDFKPLEKSTGENIKYKNSKYLLNIKTDKEINYIKLAGIPGDLERGDYELGKITAFGTESEEIKGWFVNRALYSKQGKGFTETMQKNLTIAMKTFGILDETITFEYIEPRSQDIMLKTSKGNIYFEYLSSGYKTCIIIILGVLKEIEFRFEDMSHEDFDGIIMIDEVELHLHPTWQARLMKLLKEIFPNAQIIVSTHSPSVLQSIERDEIIALAINEDGDTIVKDLNLGEYGLQGWTLEEILQDVMEMPSTTSELYKNTIEAFDKAMSDDNIIEIKRNYEILDQMLHPTSVQRKLLQIQMAGMEA